MGKMPLDRYVAGYFSALLKNSRFVSANAPTPQHAATPSLPRKSTASPRMLTAVRRSALATMSCTARAALVQ